MRRLVTTALGLLALTGAAPVDAQTLVVTVSSAESAQPLQGALLTLRTPNGERVQGGFSDALGRRVFQGIPRGEYVVRAELIGFGTGTRPVTLDTESVVRVEIAMPTEAIELEGLRAEASGRCEVRPAAGLSVARVWDEVRKALEAARETSEHGVYQYRTRRYSRNVDDESGRVTDQQTRVGQAYQTTPYESRPVDDLLTHGFVQDSDDAPGGEMYYAPDAFVLLSDPFLDFHCLRLEIGEDENAGLVGVGFEPLEDRRISDIAGTFWVDPGSWHLSHLDFSYVHTRPDIETYGTGGEVRFQRLPDGTWIVPEWRIRAPLLAVGRDASGDESIYQFGFHDEGASVLSVREPGGDVLFTSGTGALEGVVVSEDSGSPVSGVVVRLDGVSRSAITAADGGFRLTDVPEGEYVVTASSGGAEDELATGAVSLEAGDVTSVTLVAAGVLSTHQGACRAAFGPPPAETAILAGRVTHGETGEGLDGVRISVEWDDLSTIPTRGGIGRAEVNTKSGAGGQYRFCAVPTDVQLRISARWRSWRAHLDSVRIPPLTRATEHGVAIVFGGDPSEPAVVDAMSEPVADAAPADVVPIEGLDVEVEARIRRLELVGYYERMSANRGVFLDAEEITERLPTTFIGLFDGTPGVRIATTSGTTGAREVLLVTPGCLPAVWIDGTLSRRAQPFERNPNPMVTGAGARGAPLYLTDLVRAGEIAGIEVYRNSTEVPLQYGGTSTQVRGGDFGGGFCGVVVVWTR